jgi:photosystem II stability/assembly factor-like uncharacterized protein
MKKLLTMIKTLHYCLIAFFSFFCLTPGIVSQTKWELLNPKPSYNTGKEVKFISENIGYILNDIEILETLDSGVTWKKKQDINSGNDLKFYNNLGYIVGNNGYVLKSLDFGASWTQVNTGFTANFNTVTIVNESTIIISSSNSIVKSTNGGSSWVSLNVPNGGINKTFFTTPLVGHAACDYGRMLKTIDGGINWYATMTSNLVPSDLFTVYFINQNIGFATRQHSELYKTIDGGETWTEIPNISDALYNFSFLNENVGYAVGEEGVVLKTVNGGLNWEWASSQKGRYVFRSIYGIHFLDSDRGFVTGTQGRILKTTDGGKTWSENSPTYNNINNLQFVTKTTGFAQTGNSFFKTTDSGSSWNIVGSINEDRYYSVSTFKFLNENLGYAATGGTYGGYIFKTTDGGVTWNELNNGSEVIDEGIKKISVLDENTVVISGGYNIQEVLKTTDGGRNWVKVSNYSFDGMQFLDKDTGYAYRQYEKKIYKTIDGGLNWTVMFTAQEEIRSIDFVDKDNGYLVGSNGLIFKTNNGGVDWKKLTIPYEYYTSVKFYSKNVGYLFDEDGKLYKTENGGISWNYIFNLPSGYWSNAISIIEKDIYLWGANGRILKSEVDFRPFKLELNPAENILSRSAMLSGNVSVNKDYFDNVRLEYFDSSVTHKRDISTTVLNKDTSSDFSLSVTDLNPNSTYYYRIVATRDNVPYYSEMKTFKTKEDYLLTINSITNNFAIKAGISGTIVSYKYDITDVEFQYSTEQNFAKNGLLNNSIIVKGNTTENVDGVLTGLTPETLYYVRLKAKHQGKEVYSKASSFKTPPEYEISLFYGNIVENDVKLSCFVTSNNYDITNIVLEYGVLNYENSTATDISTVLAGSSKFITTSLVNLDPTKIYFYRLKALNGTNVIYGREGMVNTSKQLFLKAGNVVYNDKLLKFTGYVSTIGGEYLTNIEFEYGTTQNLGSSVKSTPNYAYSYGTYSFSADLDNPLKGETYYYRLKGLNGSSTVVYSDIMSFTTKSLGIEVPKFGESIFLYPNPTEGVVNIDLPDNKNIVSIFIIDELGKMSPYEKNLEKGNKQKIDLAGRSSGVYFLRIIMDDKSILNRKVILK